MNPEHPLEGVLDRLLRRERGGAPPVDHRKEEGGRGARADEAPPNRRRLLPVAGQNVAGRRAVLRLLARWAVGAGWRTAALEVGAGPSPGSSRNPSDGPAIPIASIPCSPSRLRAEPAGRRTGVIERLSLHERAAELLLAWIPDSDRPTLMRAAFLAGALAIPVEETDRSVHRALGLARELRRCFEGAAVWSVPVSTAGARRFAEMAREFLDMEVVVLEPDLPLAAELLNRLSPPPENGFTTALLEPDAQEPPSRLLHLDTLDL